MTEAYRMFILIVNNYISGIYDAQTFVNAINNIWWNHESDFAYYGRNDGRDEYSIVGDVYELVDKYDSCEEIVKEDPYCIDNPSMKKLLLDRLSLIQSPVYN